jgi:hypothetical protein
MLAQMRVVLQWAQYAGLSTATQDDRARVLRIYLVSMVKHQWRAAHPERLRMDFGTGVPDCPFGVDLREAYENHDLWYGMRAARQEGDARLRDEIEARFRAAGKPWLGAMTAQAVYRGVRAMGWVFYQTRAKRSYCAATQQAEAIYEKVVG